MSLTTDLVRRKVLDAWIVRRNAAVNRLSAFRALAVETWPAYRDRVENGLTAEDKAEVDSLIALVGTLAGVLAANAGDDAGQNEIDAVLAKFDPVKRERTPDFARWLIDNQKTAGVSAKSCREVRADLKRLRNDVEADLATFTAEDAAAITASIKGVKDALTAISVSNASNFATAIATLVV